MSRPTKCRRVCHFPPSPGFFPIQKGEANTPVILTVDEYETIRLMDLEGLSQQECSQWMEVARTTVQRIYENARKKLALALGEAITVCATAMKAAGTTNVLNAPIISNMKKRREPIL